MKIWRALFSFYLRFEIFLPFCLFALLPTNISFFIVTDLVYLGVIHLVYTQIFSKNWHVKPLDAY